MPSPVFARLGVCRQAPEVSEDLRSLGQVLMHPELIEYQ